MEGGKNGRRGGAAHVPAEAQPVSRREGSQKGGLLRDGQLLERIKLHQQGNAAAKGAPGKEGGQSVSSRASLQARACSPKSLHKRTRLTARAPHAAGIQRECTAIV